MLLVQIKLTFNFQVNTIEMLMVTTDMAYHNTSFGRLDLTFASFFSFFFF
jgi:hypothetical protein